MAKSLCISPTRPHLTLGYRRSDVEVDRDVLPVRWASWSAGLAASNRSG